MKELSIEEKAKRYDEAIIKFKPIYDLAKEQGRTIDVKEFENIFPELKKFEDDGIIEWLIGYFNQYIIDGMPQVFGNGLNVKDVIAWLEKQGKETSWKPSKEEMDVLYGLAYITNQYDEHKEEVITRLYQDLKREFFNGSSYENMFPNTEDGVRRRSTRQVLEYARSLDSYNQYGKEDIYKDIAWLEKQGGQKPIEWSGKIGSKHAKGKLKEMLDRKEKPAWSEEDSAMLDNIVAWIEGKWGTLGGRIGGREKFISFLKSLKDRYTWKPSDEQMEQLHNVFNNISARWEDSVIESLYNDLNKLKG